MGLPRSGFRALFRLRFGERDDGLLCGPSVGLHVLVSEIDYPLDRHRERNAEYRAYRAHEPPPEQQRKEYDQYRHLEFLAEIPGLDDVVHDRVEDYVAHDDEYAVPPPVFQKRKERRRDDRENEPDVRYEAEEESEEPPQHGEIDAQYQEQNEVRDGGYETGYGVNGHVLLEVVRYVAEPVLPGVLREQSPVGFYRDVGEFYEYEHHQQHDEEEVAEGREYALEERGHVAHDLVGADYVELLHLAHVEPPRRQGVQPRVVKLGDLFLIERGFARNIVYRHPEDRGHEPHYDYDDEYREGEGYRLGPAPPELPREERGDGYGQEERHEEYVQHGGYLAHPGKDYDDRRAREERVDVEFRTCGHVDAGGGFAKAAAR